MSQTEYLTGEEARNEFHNLLAKHFSRPMNKKELRERYEARVERAIIKYIYE